MFYGDSPDIVFSEQVKLYYAAKMVAPILFKEVHHVHLLSVGKEKTVDVVSLKVPF